MIPLYSLSQVSHKEEDGVLFTYLPKTGMLEQELLRLSQSLKNGEDVMKELDAFIDKVLVKWAGPDGQEHAQKDEKFSSMFTYQEKLKLVGLWHKANELSVEIKKN